MHSPRFSFHPLLLVVIGLASGALALGAATLGGGSRGEASREGKAGVPSRAAGAKIESGLALSAVARRSGPFFAASVSPERYRRFPSLYSPETPDALGFLEPLSLFPRAMSSADRAAFIPAIANNQILAFYGKPDSRKMGILGEYSKEELAALLEGYAKLYDDQNGDDGVVPAFYLIYGTCWPGGDIGYLKESVIRDYIDFAREKGMLVFVDHQIGKYPVADAMSRLLPWLKYPNVHIALDPEWRTESPMQEIGSVSAEEINSAEASMSDYMNAEGIPGVKMLVVHQFQGKMISDREKVRADYDGVLLVHTADGFGPPALKRASYSFNSRALNMPLKGFKLFFKTTVEGAGYDDPLLLPAEVLTLDPRPRLIIYQ
jgi:hypothetical protein